MAESRLQNTSPRDANLVRQLNKYRHRRPIRFFGGGPTVHEPAGLTLSAHCTLSRKRQNVTISPFPPFFLPVLQRPLTISPLAMVTWLRARYAPYKIQSNLPHCRHCVQSIITPLKSKHLSGLVATSFLRNVLPSSILR